MRESRWSSNTSAGINSILQEQSIKYLKTVSREEQMRHIFFPNAVDKGKASGSQEVFDLECQDPESMINDLL